MQFRVEEIPQKEQPKEEAPTNATPDETTKEATPDEAEVEVEESTEAIASPEKSSEDTEVPLRKLMRERRKRQEYEAELARIQKEHEQDAAALAEFRAAVPKIQETWQENQRLRAEHDALRERHEALVKMAENSEDFDMSSLEEANLRRELSEVKRQLASLPDVVRAQLQEGRRQDEERRVAELRRAEEARSRERARESFEREFNEITSGVDVLAKQKDHYLAVFESTGGAVTARELLEPIVASMAAPGIIKERRDAAPRTQGTTPGVRSAGEPVTKTQEGETLSEYLARMKEALRKGLIKPA